MIYIYIMIELLIMIKTNGITSFNTGCFDLRFFRQSSQVNSDKIL
jgi:hypothetical protein